MGRVEKTVVSQIDRNLSAENLYSLRFQRYKIDRNLIPLNLIVSIEHDDQMDDFEWMSDLDSAITPLFQRI